MRQRVFLEHHMIRSVVARCMAASRLTATLAVKRSLLATVSCLALTGTVAAADLPTPMPMKAPPAVVPTWAGFYLGVNGGAIWHRLATDTVFGSINLENGTPHDSATTTATSGTFGGQVGYNWQSRNFVYGLEGDFNWVNARGSDSQGPSFFTVVYTTRLSWLATARARAGLAVGQTLLYGTGGFAAGGVDNSWGVAGSSLSIVSRGTRTGWTAGGGVEHLFSNPHVTVRAEALYVDLGSRTLEDQGGQYRARFKNTGIVGRVGVNLKW
jgi:outer membrane immunogenic protein